MPHRKSDPEQQFLAVENMIMRWLKERRELLGKYTEMAVTLDHDMDNNSLQQRQAALCLLLVDYVSTGHFEIFQELISEAEAFADDGGSALAKKLMPAIADTTEVIMAYEEKYGSGRSSDKLKRDLSALGEVLESRFTLEDQLISGLHYRYRQPVQTRPPTGD